MPESDVWTRHAPSTDVRVALSMASRFFSTGGLGSDTSLRAYGRLKVMRGGVDAATGWEMVEDWLAGECYISVEVWIARAGPQHTPTQRTSSKQATSSTAQYDKMKTFTTLISICAVAAGSYALLTREPLPHHSRPFPHSPIPAFGPHDDADAILGILGSAYRDRGVLGRAHSVDHERSGWRKDRRAHDVCVRRGGRCSRR